MGGDRDLPKLENFGFLVLSSFVLMEIKIAYHKIGSYVQFGLCDTVLTFGETVIIHGDTNLFFINVSERLVLGLNLLEHLFGSFILSP